MLLRLKCCLRRHIESTLCKIFAFSHHFPCYNQVSVTTNIKDSSLLVRIQDSEKENSAAWWKLRAILRLCWTAMKTNWCKNMRIYNTAVKLCRFIHIMLWKKVLNSRKLLEYFGILAVAWSYRALQKNPPLSLRKNLLATAGNLKVNEQSNYKSVRFFLFLDIERKPEIWNYWIYEPAI